MHLSWWLVYFAFLPPLVYLYVGLCEGDHLRQDLRHVQVVNLKPLPRAGVEDVDPVVPFLRTAVMDNVGDKVVRGPIAVPVLHVSRQQVSELDMTQREVDNGRVFLLT